MSRGLGGGPWVGTSLSGPGLITWVSISSLSQRPGRGVWARTVWPHKSPDLCGSCLLAAMSLVPFIYL